MVSSSMFSILKTLPRIFRAICLLFGLVCAILIGLGYWMFGGETTPDLVKKEVMTQLYNAGLNVDCSSLELNLVHGITMKNVIWTQEFDGHKVFVQAPVLKIETDIIDLLYKKRKISSLKVDSAMVECQLDDNEKSFSIKNISFELVLNNDNWVLENTRIKLLGVNFNISGAITNISKYVAKKKSAVEFEPSELYQQVEDGYNTFVETLENHPIAKKMFEECQRASKDSEKSVVQLKFELPADNFDLFDVKVYIDLPRYDLERVAIKSHTFTGRIDKYSLRVNDFTVKTVNDDGFSAQGEYFWESSELSGSLKLSTYPHNLVELVPETLPILKEQLSQIKANKDPLQLDVELPRQVISSKPLLSFSLQASDVKLFDALLINKGKITGEYKDGIVHLATNMVTINNEISVQCTGTIMPEIDDMYFSIKLVGEPNFAEHFIPEENKEPFKRICDMFTWAPKNPPSLNISVHSGPESFQVFGDVNVPRFSMQGVKLQSMRSYVVFEAGVDEMTLILNNLNVVSEKKKTVSGAVLYHIPYHDDFMGKVNLELNGNMNPVQVFTALDIPTDIFDDMTFADKSDFVVSGNYDIDHSENSNLSILVDTAEFTYYDYKLENANAEVIFKEDRVEVNSITADFYGGSVRANYEVDLATKNSAVQIEAKDFDLAKTPLVQSQATGVTDLEMEVGVRFVEDEMPIYSGGGWIKMKDGSFWKIPLLTDFSVVIQRIVPFNRIGKITQIETGILFDERTVKLQNLKTNGDVVAFHGNGTVDLVKESVKVQLESKPLPSLLGSFIPTILRPLTKSFQIMLYGGYDDLKWRLTTGIW